MGFKPRTESELSTRDSPSTSATTHTLRPLAVAFLSYSQAFRNLNSLGLNILILEALALSHAGKC